MPGYGSELSDRCGTNTAGRRRNGLLPGMVVLMLALVIAFRVSAGDHRRDAV